MSATHFPIVIIGGGPIGLACGLEAQKAGIGYVIFEKGSLVNSLYHYPTNLTFFSTSERLEIGGIPFVSNNAKPVRAEALEYYRRVALSHRLNVHLFEKVESVEKDDGWRMMDDGQHPSNQRPSTTIYHPSYPSSPGNFSIKTTRGVYTANNIIIATGFYDIPYLLNVPGEELPKVTHYYQDPHHYAFQKVIVVGANNSAVDAALETWRKGADVTMVVRGNEIGERVKYWVRPDIVNRISEGSIKALFNSTIREIKETEVIVDTPGGPITLANDWVIAATGYQPNLGFLERLGIHLTDDAVRKPAYDEATHESNVPGIFLAGVICGGMNTHRLFIENSREHAEKILRTISTR
jgi:thioredoxin reductase (NADPH)